MFQSKAKSKGLDGVAVVSTIIAAESPKNAAAELRRMMSNTPAFGVKARGLDRQRTAEGLLLKAPSVISRLSRMNPLCHNMTNLVVQNFAANVALAM